MIRVLLRKIKSFAGLPWSTKRLFAEALFTAAYVKTTLVFLPFKKVAGWLGTANVQQHGGLTENAQVDLLKKIQFAIKLVDKYAPWPTECYTQSLTAKIMLRRRGWASTLYFGFGKNEQGELKGHAWLRCSGMIITGFTDLSQYTVHSSFS